MTCQALICAVDQRPPRRRGDAYRPRKHRVGQVIYVKDTPCRWGRMEGPRGGSMVLEVGSTKAYLERYLAEVTNRPRLTYGLHHNHIRCTMTMPPAMPLAELEFEYLNLRFNGLVHSVGPYVCEFDLRAEAEVQGFPRAFFREFVDKLSHSAGPRYLVDPAVCRQVAHDGGFGRCDVAAFEAAIIDRTRRRFLTDAEMDLAV